MQRSTTRPLVTLVIATCLLTACDSNKEQRAGLSNQLSTIESDITKQKQQREVLSRSVQTLNADIKRDADNLPAYSQRRAKLQDELSSFLLDHKLATVAVIAAGGAAATFIDDNIDEDTKNTLRVVGLVGALYCIANSDECADVTARVVYFGSQIQEQNKTISDITSRLASMRTSLQARDKELVTLDSTIAARQRERDALKEKHDSMLCTFCL
jgi:septal ring factor EnvC (AmiA/AmiB activator)